jgi:subtilisin family serine protease
MGPDKEKFFMERTLQELLHRLETTILRRRIANNVEILTVRAVPDGDEYDKDIALGIRYAVDNGAKVINGSFGSFFRIRNGYMMPSKYAEKKDVLIVHAAGNDGKD